MSKLSHVDSGNRPTMVDVSDKEASDREACARTIVHLPDVVAAAIEGDEIQSKKGPVFATAIIAGIMGAKKTHDLIPFCHPLGLEKCDVRIAVDGSDLVIECRCKVHHKTGVELEALTGATIAALTVYDMCKALSHDIVIAETRLVTKTGGKQDFEHRD